MRFYAGQHLYYCGIDLHARTMYLCIFDNETGNVLLHRNLRTEPARFLRAVAPYCDDIVVGVECIFCWYWLADLCAEQDIPFVLGHALYMKAIHGGKAKNDRVDALKIATLLRGGAFPMAYVYPRGMRATRDLMRRRLFFERRRSELFGHIRMTFHQLNLPDPGGAFHHPRGRVGLAEAIPDPVVRASVEADLALAARLYELHDIERFSRVGDFLSYARLVKSQKASAGKVMGTSGAKIGNAHLKWAYSEAAVLFLQKNPPGQRLINRRRSKHGRGKALSILASRIGRASYFMRRRSTAFDMDRFMN